MRSVLAIICISSHRRLKIGLERLKIYQNEAMELVDKDFKEKVKKNNVLRPHSLWFGLSSPPYFVFIGYQLGMQLKVI